MATNFIQQFFFSFFTNSNEKYKGKLLFYKNLKKHFKTSDLIIPLIYLVLTHSILKLY